MKGKVWETFCPIGDNILANVKGRTYSWDAEGPWEGISFPWRWEISQKRSEKFQSTRDMGLIPIIFPGEATPNRNILQHYDGGKEK